jgi:predicted acyl esterase
MEGMTSWRVELSRAARKDDRAEGWRMTDTGGIVIERDLMVPARDGVLLATDVYRPEGPGPFPVLLERTPYDK